VNHILARAEDFICRNARLLDRRRFEFHFKGGSAGRVIDALLAYQNDDGGFGNAIEPDIRGPDSQPRGAEMALELFDEVSAWDSAVAARVLSWIESVTLPAGGLPWVLPSVERYAAASWWLNTDYASASLNPTAGIAGLLLQHGVQHPWVERAEDFCWRQLDRAEEADEEYHTLMCTGTFLTHAADRPRANAHIERLREAIRRRPADEPGAYAKTPVMWALRPSSPWVQVFSEEQLNADLDALVERQLPDGSWELGFPATSEASEMEWRGSFALGWLLILRYYGRLG
jgi:hypothetical protein